MNKVNFHACWCLGGALKHTFFVAWGEYTPSLTDVSRMTLLIMFREASYANSPR